MRPAATPTVSGWILFVDDSAVARKLVSTTLARAGFTVLTAPNGRLAVEKLAQNQIDVVVLDVEMPELDGLETLREVRVRWPSLPVIMFSALTERAGSMTLDALAMGASDYVTKPTSVGPNPVAYDAAFAELLTKIRALIPVRAAAPSKAVVAEAAPRLARPVDVVALGASTGGPNALVDALSPLPADFPAPIVIAQHMPPVFTQLFAARLDRVVPLRVREAVDGQELVAGDVWVAPGDYHLHVVRRGSKLFTRVDQSEPVNSCRPAVDVLFRSVASACGGDALAVVLTGMGMDGLRGCETLRAAGAEIVVQDEATSVVWSMPGSVAKAGLADSVCPIGRLGDELLRRVLARRNSFRVPAAIPSSPNTKVDA